MTGQRVGIERIDRLDRIATTLVIVSRVLLAALAIVVVVSRVGGV